MHLTARQLEFLTMLIELYDEQEKPVHYIDIARRLGVSKWTAYDMMTVLEKRGVVAREYAITERSSEGGRSQVMFRPTEKGRSILLETSDELLEEEEWDKTKQSILATIERISEEEYRVAAEQIIKMVDSCSSSLAYWAGSMTALLLTVKDMKRRLREIPLLQGIMQRVRSTRARLLASAEVGASLPRIDLGSSELHERLEDFLRKHDMIIDQMGINKQRKLLRFLGIVIQRLAEPI